MEPYDKAITDKIVNSIIKELNNPIRDSRLTMFLDVMKLDLKNGIPQIAGIQQTDEGASIVAYVKVKEAKFYLAFYFDPERDYEFIFCGPFPEVSIEYRIYTGAKYTKEEVLDMVKIKPGYMEKLEDFEDETKDGKTVECWAIHFETYKGPGNISHKLDYLLDMFLRDETGFKKLFQKTRYKSIDMDVYFHVYNGEVDELYITPEQANKLARLGLGVHFKLCPEGKQITPVDLDFLSN